MKNKKFLMVLVTAVAGVLALGSVASACTAWIGRFEVTGDKGNNGGTGTGTVVVDGKGSRTFFSMTQCVSDDVTHASASGGSVTIRTDTSPQASGCNNYPDVADRKLPECGSGGSAPACTGSNKRNYNIRFYNSGPAGTLAGYSNHTTWREDCMSTTSSPLSVKLGTATVDSTGKLDSATVGSYGGNGFNAATKTAHFNLPSGLNKDVPPRESALCITDNAAYYGNQAPVTIV